MARRGTVEDVVECCALHESLPLPYPKNSKRVLPEIWRTLLSNGVMQLFLVEDRARPVGSRVVSFGGSVFATDEFCSEARSTLPPYLSVELARRYSSRHSPTLKRDRVARANGDGGLNVVMCFQGWARDGSSPERSLAILEKHGEALHLALRGYRIKEFLAEPIGWETLQWMIDAGAKLRRDYSDDFPRNGFPEPEPSHRPFLVGLTREEALAHPGGNIA